MSASTSHSTCEVKWVLNSNNISSSNCKRNLIYLIILTNLIFPIISTSPPSLDFAEAILDVDTMAPAQLLNLNNMVISEKSSELVEIKGRELLDLNDNNLEDDRSKIEIIEPTDFLRDCGRNDKCSPDTDDTNQESSNGFSSRTRNIDFKYKPYTCRCDKECYIFGDCCWNITIGLPLRNESLWSCKYIHEKKEWAMMISKCPADSGLNFLSNMCTATPGTIPDQNYTYLLDIPVYSRDTQNLYRNIYCARCHREKNPSLVHWKTRLHCNDSMSPQEQTNFLQKAYYSPGDRYFQLGNQTCAIFITDLLNDTLNSTIPSLRYCGESIDSCPLPGPGDDPLEEEEMEMAIKDKKLCSIYTQHVTSNDRRIFKNPHCARCNGVAIKTTNFTIPRLSSACYMGLGTINPLKFSPAAPKGPQGISLLFDFALDSDEVLVGYEMRCRDEEIWDYIHRRCQMAICQKGYYLQDDSCHLILSPIEDNSSDGDHSYRNSSGDLISDDLLDDPINSTCMRLLVFEGEYSFVNNTSIIINSSILSQLNHPIIVHSEEYEFWNETTLSVCAKHLHEGYITRFSPALNYVSTISLTISVIFSFIHILLYLSLPKLRNLPGKNLFCLTLSLFVSQLIFLTLIKHSKWKGVCVTAAITMHYLFLAAFFWMSVMSFDIWRTFSGAVVLSRNQSPEGKQVTFLKYNLFAWLTPLVIVTLAILVEYLPENFKSTPDSSENLILKILDKIKPSYGQNGICWIGQRLSLFIFFAVPVALVITANLILFSFTAKAILSQNKEAGKVLQNKESKMACAKKSSNTSGTSKEGHHEEINVKLYAKLALIMGLTWTLGFGTRFEEFGEWIHYPFVIFNGLQGTFIFFAFDFKWKILKMLKERYGKCCKDGSKGHRFGGRKHGVDTSGTISHSHSTSYSRTLSTTVETK